MAQVYKRVGGRKITKIIALTEQAQRAVDEAALKGAVKAEGLLAMHRHDGDARIVVEKGDVDSYVVLDDERGLDAALSIEYGRQPDEDGRGGMEGLFILHDAMGLRRPGG